MSIRSMEKWNLKHKMSIDSRSCFLISLHDIYKIFYIRDKHRNNIICILSHRVNIQYAIIHNVTILILQSERYIKKLYLLRTFFFLFKISRCFEIFIKSMYVVNWVLTIFFYSYFHTSRYIKAIKSKRIKRLSLPLHRSTDSRFTSRCRKWRVAAVKTTRGGCGGCAINWQMSTNRKQRRCRVRC